MTSTREAQETRAAALGRCPECGKPRADLSTPCEHCGAAPLGPADAVDEGVTHRRDAPEAIMQVRAADMEPYVGLRYVAKLFRLMALILVLLLIAEIVTGLTTQGSGAIPTLLAEGSRLIVLSGLLWASGDLAILLIDIGHDVRATRILIGRQSAHHLAEHPPARRREERERVVERKTERQRELAE
ncbi:MAG TPA: hypothetical protein VJ802_02785 [Gemmatimonadaceae bacterium]|nr:hypothetical protein [Gemmatimonadaceae bacterium]